MSQRRRRGHGHARGSCIIYSGGTAAVLPLSLVQQTSMEITRTDSHRFSTKAHRGFTTDTAVLLWIHTDLVQPATADFTREWRARRLTERIVQEETLADCLEGAQRRSRCGERTTSVGRPPRSGRRPWPPSAEWWSRIRGERSGTDRTGYCDRTGLLGPPTVAVRRTPSGGISHAAVLV